MNSTQKTLLVIALFLGVLIFAGEAYISRADSVNDGIQIQSDQGSPNQQELTPKVEQPQAQEQELSDDALPEINQQQKQSPQKRMQRPYQQPQPYQPYQYQQPKRRGCGPGCG